MTDSDPRVQERKGRVPELGQIERGAILPRKTNGPST